MNKKQRNEKIYMVGDLVCFSTDECMALVVAKQFSHLFDEYEYRVHFCSDEAPDERWLFGSVFSNVARW